MPLTSRDTRIAVRVGRSWDDAAASFNGGMTRRNQKIQFLKISRITLSLVLLVLATAGCGGSSGQLTAADLSASALDSAGGPTAGNPGTASPISDSPVSTAPLPSNAYPSTTPGGYYTVTSEHSLQISSEETPLGFGVANGNFLFFESLSLSGGITRWRVLSTPVQPGTTAASWSVACDLLGDGSRRTGFGADSLYFYLPGSIASDPYNTQYLMRISQSDCSMAPTLDIGTEIPGDNSDPDALTAVFGGQFLFGSENFSSLALSFWDLTSGALSSLTLDPTLGGVGLAYPSAFAFSPGIIWVMDSTNLWKLDPSGNAVAWAALPSDALGEVMGLSAVVSVDSDTLVLISIMGQEITRYYLDVSQL